MATLIAKRLIRVKDPIEQLKKLKQRQLEIVMTKTIPVYIKEDDGVKLDKELPAEAIKFEKQAWTCPVCGLNRGKGNHQECAQITQLKHQQERKKALNSTGDNHD